MNRMTALNSKPADIAMFMPSMAGGGAEKMTLHLIAGFVQRGLRVELVLAHARGPNLSRVPASVRVIDLQAPRVRNNLLGRCMHYLRQEQPHVIISGMHYTNIVALCAQRLVRVPTRVIVCEQSTLSQYVRRTPLQRGQVMVKLMPLLAHYCYPWAAGIVAVSHQSAEDMAHAARLPLSRIHIIYNPIVMPDIIERASQPVDHPWFAPGEPPVILGVGRLSQPKDFPTLIRAFYQVRQQCPARLLILGEGEDRAQLASLIHDLQLGDSVALPGYVDNPYAYMQRAAIFALSSIWEGLPSVLVEAMACGTPVVATDCESGPREILADGTYGPLVPMGDSTALAQAILATLNNTGEPAASRAALLQERASLYSLDRSVDAYLALLGLN